MQVLTASDAEVGDLFGGAVSISNGDIVVGKPSSKTVYIYHSYSSSLAEFEVSCMEEQQQVENVSSIPNINPAAWNETNVLLLIVISLLWVLIFITVKNNSNDSNKYHKVKTLGKGIADDNSDSYDD